MNCTLSCTLPVLPPKAQCSNPLVIAEMSGITKCYGTQVALSGFSLTLHPGEVVVLLGPNGAGKSSAMNLLTGLRQPDCGWVRLFGKDPRSIEARRRLGVTPQNMAFPTTLSVREVLDLIRAHYPAPVELASILERFELSHLRDRAAARLSLGEQRRLAVAAAFIGKPDLAVLDEPTTGLDAESRHAVWREVRAHAERGGTVLLSTHYFEEAESLASRVVVVAHGQTLFDGSTEAIKSRLPSRCVRVRQPVDLPIADVVESRYDNGFYVLHTTQIASVVKELIARRIPFDQFEIEPLSLERAFLDLTEHASS